MSNEPLKPCPFCGGKARHSQVIPGPGERFGCTACVIDAYTAEDWNRRTPSPATAKLIRCIKADLEPTDKMLDAFLAEWPGPATPTAPEQPAPSSPYLCAICGQPIRLASNMRPYHLSGPTNHEAEMSSEDLKAIADGLRLTD